MMMGPISAVNLGSAGAAAGLSTTGTTESAPQGGGTTAAQLNAAGILTGSQALTSVHSAVSQLLQSVGGGAENDKLLRLLIVLLILMSLLEQQQGDQASMGQSLAQLGAGSADRSQFVGIFSSSTTISIEQTSTSIMLATGSEAFNANGEALPQAGGGFDFSV